MSDPLENLQQAIGKCRYCIETPYKTPLPHEPRPVVQLSSKARLCIAGQAPGTRVHASGKPFTDPSGDRLREWMGIGEDVFYNPDKVAIVPMGFCFPGLDKKGGDLPPRQECKDLWHDEIYQNMPQLELVLVIGQYAQAYHLGKERQKNLTATVMDWQRLWHLDKKPRVLPLPHPSWRNNAWLKKNLWFENDLLPVLKQEVRYLVE